MPKFWKYWLVRKTKTGFTIIDNPKYGFKKDMGNARQRQSDLYHKTGEWYIIIKEYD